VVIAVCSVGQIKRMPNSVFAGHATATEDIESTYTNVAIASRMYVADGRKTDLIKK